MAENQQSGARRAGSGAGQAGERAGQAVQSPRPTEDQQEYLDRMSHSAGDFNPNIVVGGPRRIPA
jgi:hypothetical protein